MFGLADADRVRRILDDAGWSDVQLDDEQVPYDYGAEPATAARHASEIGVLRDAPRRPRRRADRAGDGRAHRAR